MRRTCGLAADPTRILRLVHHNIASRRPRIPRPVAPGTRGDARIQFPAPVPMRQLATFLNRFDAGVYLFASVSADNRGAAT
jgi:hypothetical protein